MSNLKLNWKRGSYNHDLSKRITPPFQQTADRPILITWQVQDSLGDGIFGASNNLEKVQTARLQDVCIEWKGGTCDLCQYSGLSPPNPHDFNLQPPKFRSLMTWQLPSPARYRPRQVSTIVRIVTPQNTPNLFIKTVITCQVQTPSGKCPPESKSVIPSWINFNKSTFPFTCEKDHSPQLKHLDAGFSVGSISWFWSYQLIAVVLIFTAVRWIDDNTLKRKINLKSDLKWQQRAHLGILCPWRRRGTEQQAGRSPASPRASCAATPRNRF